MQRTFLKAKLHKVHVTHSELEYEGSCAIDSELLKIAGIEEYEQLHIYNLENGERFTTYAIRAKERSGIISVNGAAAHLANKGDRLIICIYAIIDAEEISSYKPTLVYVDKDNKITHSRHAIPIQVA